MVFQFIVYTRLKVKGLTKDETHQKSPQTRLSCAYTLKDASVASGNRK